MKILLTNDDGIQGEGLNALALALKKAGHDVTVVAPDVNNSAVSHKVTMNGTLELKRLDEQTFSLSGTPADCVLFALNGLGIRPDLIVAGINEGINLGSDCMYSGTVGAAMEGAQNGFRSIALSLRIRKRHTPEERRTLFAGAAELAAERLTEWAALSCRIEGILNVNVPDVPPKGVRLCRASRTRYATGYKEESDGIYRMESNPPAAADGEEGDIPLLNEGYVTVTPLLLNLTDFESLSEWRKGI